MDADISIHDKQDGNPHTHIMLTLGLFEKDGSWKSNPQSSTLLIRKARREKWRNKWANTCNKHFELSYKTARID